MRNKKKQLAIDLTTVDPHGRVDVLALQFLNKFAAARLPELVPVIEQNKGVIHATLNEKLGPDTMDADLVKAVVQAGSALFPFVESYLTKVCGGRL